MTDQEYTDILNRYNTLVDPIANNGTAQQYISTFLSTAGQTTVNLAFAPNTNYTLGVYINNKQQPVSAFSLSVLTITFTSTLSLNDAVTIVYYA